MDNSEKNPKWRLLCSILKNGVCEKTKTFVNGEHNLTIEVLDKAGNREEIKNIIFSIE